MEAFYNANSKNLNTVVVRTIAGMGAMGLVLALIGLYGLTAYAVSRRTREIGIRMAMGAMPASVLRMIMRQGALPSAAGIVLGVLASLAAGGVIESVVPQHRRRRHHVPADRSGLADRGGGGGLSAGAPGGAHRSAGGLAAGLATSSLSHGTTRETPRSTQPVRAASLCSERRMRCSSFTQVVAREHASGTKCVRFSGVGHWHNS